MMNSKPCKILQFFLGHPILVQCPKKALHEYGVSQEELEDFTENVMTSQGRLMANNYTELDRDEVRAIYERLY